MVAYDGRMAIEDPVHRFSTEEYTAIVESGALEDVRAELLDGLLVDKMTQGDPHAVVIMRLMEMFAPRIHLLHVQMPLQIEDGWVPEPDVFLAERPPGRHPSTAFIAVEVGASGLSRAHRKAPPYARAGIPRYWIVDIAGRRVLEHTEPGADGYGVVTILTGDDVLDAGVEGVPATTVAELLADL